VRIYIYTYRYVLPGSDLDGETFAVRRAHDCALAC